MEIQILKPLSERERVAVYKALEDTPGEATKDFAALEKVKEFITDEEWQMIANTKLRKIIIVNMTRVCANSSKETFNVPASRAGLRSQPVELRPFFCVLSFYPIVSMHAAIKAFHADS